MKKQNKKRNKNIKRQKRFKETNKQNRKKENLNAKTNIKCLRKATSLWGVVADSCTITFTFGVTLLGKIRTPLSPTPAMGKIVPIVFFDMDSLNFHEKKKDFFHCFSLQFFCWNHVSFQIGIPSGLSARTLYFLNNTIKGEIKLQEFCGEGEEEQSCHNYIV